MSLPPQLRASTTPYELEFIANEQLIEIVPLFSMDRIRLLSGTYGPFKPPTKAKIPLWMALNLKVRRKCHIVPPDWLNHEYLQEKLNDETSIDSYSALPFHYAEMAKVLLDVASDDLHSPDRIRSLLKDLREARQAKSREGLRVLNDNHLRMVNIGSMEINEIRPFFVKAMGVLTKLAPEKPPEVPEGSFDASDTFAPSFSNDTSDMDFEW